MRRDPFADQRELVNKRLTLNLLIQGSAQHAFLTVHHLFAAQLRQMDTAFVDLYDRLALGGVLTNFYGMNVLATGRPAAFWKKVRNGRHPLAFHPVLFAHGEALSTATRDRAVERAEKLGMAWRPFHLSQDIIAVIQALQSKEAGQRYPLEQLAVEATREIWGVPAEKLHPALTQEVQFGKLRPVRSLTGLILRAGAAGYGGVIRGENGELEVHGRGCFWPLLVHELVKGVAELICLHGMTHCAPEQWARVVEEADRPEYETWLLMTGAELWRRLLQVHPPQASLARTLMRLACQDDERLETILVAIIEDPPWAGELLESLEPVADRLP